MSLYKRKNKWWMDVRINGIRKRLPTGTGNKKTAEMIHARVLTNVQEGKWFEHELQSQTLKEIIEKYLKEMSPSLSPASHERNILMATRFKSFLGDTLITDVTASSLSEYKAMRLEKVTPSTVKKELSFLRRVFSVAVEEWEVCKENPVKKVLRSLKVDDKRVRYLTADEAMRLRFTLPAWLIPIVIVASQTGLRKGNLLALTVQQVHFDEMMLFIPKTKNGEPLVVPMTTIVRDTFRKTISGRRVVSPYVFCDDCGKPYSAFKVSMAFRRACNRAGIENLRFNDLRHDFASQLVQSGVSLYKVQHLLGHKDQRMTQRYAHLLPENLRDAMMTMEHSGTARIVAGG